MTEQTIVTLETHSFLQLTVREIFIVRSVFRFILRATVLLISTTSPLFTTFVPRIRRLVLWVLVLIQSHVRLMFVEHYLAEVYFGTIFCMLFFFHKFNSYICHQSYFWGSLGQIIFRQTNLIVWKTTSKNGSAAL